MAKLALLGGKKAWDKPWPAWPVWGEEERQALREVLDSGKWWYGQKVKEFESAFAAFQDARWGVTCTSGTTALEIAMLALGIEEGDEVIVPPYTFMATAVAAVRVNAVPVFADIQGDTLCLDPGDVERKITPRTKGILPVHLGGYVADMDRLGQVARKHNLFLLEDACHSWGGKWKGKGTGALGDCGVFSFQYSKNITSAEGGILLSDRQELAEEARSYGNCGRRAGKEWYCHEIAGSNLRMTEFQAAILLAQMTRLEAQTLRREADGRILDEGLGRIPGIRTVRPEPRITRRAYHFYAFRLDERALGLTRQQFMDALHAEGVPCSAGYTTPLYQMGFFRHGPDDKNRGSAPFRAGRVDYAGVRCQVCEEVCATTVWLKHSMLLADEAAMRGIVSAAAKVCENAGELASR